MIFASVYREGVDEGEEGGAGVLLVGAVDEEEEGRTPVCRITALAHL